MEAATVENVINPDTPGLGDEVPEEEVSTPVEDSKPKLFTYSTYVDLPELCEAEKTKRGSCQDPDHFHAWLRLPNRFQHKEIRDHALAARARRARQLRDEDSNSRVILEDALDLMRESDKEVLVQEIINRDAGSELHQAMKDVAEIEDDAPVEEGGEPALKYAHIDTDEERLRSLEDLAEEERPEEEYEELVKHIMGYYQAIEERQRELQEPQRASLMDRDMDDLIGIVRKDRMESEATEEFLHTYNAWSVVYGTTLANKSGRQFKHLDSLTSQAPEVIDALMAGFANLESGAQEGNL